MYEIEVTYDTGDSFHQENGVEDVISEIKWEKKSKAEKAAKEILEHYHYYMIHNKEWNADEEDKKMADEIAKKKKWYTSEYSFYNLLLENDRGIRKNVHCFWVGYFESLVGVEIVLDESLFFDSLKDKSIYRC